VSSLSEELVAIFAVEFVPADGGGGEYLLSFINEQILESSLTFGGALLLTF